MSPRLTLYRSTLYNLVGLGVPLIVAVVSIPILIKYLGDDGFGLLTLIWAVVSYFGLFDLGLGRALTQQLSIELARGNHAGIGPLVATATTLMAVLGVFAGFLLALLAPWGVDLIQFVPDRQEAVNAVLAMALAMPAIVLTPAFRGVLEARHAFGIINLIRLPMGLFTYLAPLVLVLCGANRLDVIASVLAVGRVIACAIHAWYAWRVLPRNCGQFSPKSNLLKPLSISGGWLTVSNVISPFMGYVDRFIIGGIDSAAAVAHYTTPQEIVTKLWIIPGALTAVLFPTFAAHSSHQNGEAKRLLDVSTQVLFFALLPAASFLTLFSNDLLTLWVGQEFSSKSYILLQLFAIGILINSLAHVPYTMIQGVGRSKLTAIVHILELPIFLVLLSYLTSHFGLIGAVIAWLIRMVIDTAAMFAICNWIQGWSLGRLLSVKVLFHFLILVASFGGVFLEPRIARICWLLIITGVSGVMLYRLWRTPAQASTGL